jgi:Domain of unknown function (DUF6089)
MAQMLFFKRFLFLIVLTFGVQLAQAQGVGVSQKYEFGFWLGSSNYFGDITPSAKNTYSLFRPAFGIYQRINVNPRISYKFTASYGRIAAADSFSSNIYENTRNLSFRSDIFEVSAQLEFNFFKFILEHKKFKFTPYFYMGIALFYHKPKAFYNNEWISLRDLGTEGQQFPDYTGNKPYSYIQVAVPIGGGFKYNVTKGFTIGFDIGYRATFTDYLDDISKIYIDQGVLASGENGALAASLADRSGEVTNEPIGIEGTQRGDSYGRDSYMFIGITMAITIRKLNCPPPSNSKF